MCLCDYNLVRNVLSKDYFSRFGKRVVTEHEGCEKKYAQTHWVVRKPIIHFKCDAFQNELFKRGPERKQIGCRHPHTGSAFP